MSGFMKKLLAGSSKKVQEDEDKAVVQFQTVEGQAKKMCKDLKRHCDALSSVAKVEYRVAEELFQSPSGKQNADLSQDRTLKKSKATGGSKRTASMVKDSELQMSAAYREQELTVRLKLDEERFLLEPLKKYCLLFPTVSAAINRRDAKKQDLEKLNAKVERYKEKPSPKLDIAVLDAKRAEDEFNKLDTQLATELPLLYSGRLDFMDVCVGSLIKAEINYYEDLSNSHLETLNAMGHEDIENLEEELDAKLDSLFGKLRGLSIVSSQVAATAPDGSTPSSSKK